MDEMSGREGQVSKWLSKLEKSVEALEKSYIVLEERLAVVAREKEEQLVNVSDKEERGALVPCALSIAFMVERVERVSGAIGGLLDRLEV